MKNIGTYVYSVIGLFILPTFIGVSVADALLKMYAFFSRHWIAGAFVCLLSACVVTWFPLLFLFLIEPFRSYHRINIMLLLLIGAIGGFFGPLIFGFVYLPGILGVLLMFSTIGTVAIMIDEASRQLRLDEARRYQDRLVFGTKGELNHGRIQDQ